MSKPTNKPSWNPTGNMLEPDTSKKTAGVAQNEKLSFRQLNWLFKNIAQWIDYLDEARIQGVVGDTGSQGVVGNEGSSGVVEGESVIEAHLGDLEALSAFQTPTALSVPFEAPYISGTTYTDAQYHNPSAGSETKRGYIAGGATSGGGLTVERLNFNSDNTLSVVQNEFGQELNTNGAVIVPANSNAYSGLGTQSNAHGYRFYAVGYTGIAVVNSNTIVLHKLAFANDTGAITSIRPMSGWNSTARKGLVQSDTGAYNRRGTTSPNTLYGKLSFSTDVTSNVTTATGYANNQTPYFEVGISTPTYGTFFAYTALSVSHRLTFATEVGSLTSATNMTDNGNGGHGEAVDGSSNGYFQKTSSETGSGLSVLWKVDKTTDVMTNIAGTLTGIGAGASATQGASAGYFSGGQNELSGIFGTIYGNTIKKIQYAPEVYSVHAATLKTSRCFAAGFEG